MKWHVLGAFVAVGVLWGSAWLFTPSLPEPPMLAGAARFAIAAALLGAAAGGSSVATRQTDRDQPPFPLFASIVLGLTLAGFPFALAIWAKGLVSVGVVAALYAAMPLVTLLFGETAGDAAGKIPPMAVGMGGVAFLVAQGIEYSARQMGGLLLLAAAVALGAWSLNYAKRNIQPGNILSSSAVQCAVAAVLLLALNGKAGIEQLMDWHEASVASLVVLATAEGAIAFPLLLWLLSTMEAWKAASLQWVATLVAVAEAGLFLRGEPSLQMELGAVMVVVAIIWLMRLRDEPGSTIGVVTLQITSAHQSTPERRESRRG